MNPLKAFLIDGQLRQRISENMKTAMMPALVISAMFGVAQTQAQTAASVTANLGAALADCVSKNAALLAKAPDPANDVVQAVIISCDHERQAAVAGMQSAQIEMLDQAIRRAALRQVIWERAARATIREN